MSIIMHRPASIGLLQSATPRALERASKILTSRAFSWAARARGDGGAARVELERLDGLLLPLGESDGPSADLKLRSFTCRSLAPFALRLAGLDGLLLPLAPATVAVRAVGMCSGRTRPGTVWRCGVRS